MFLFSDDSMRNAFKNADKCYCPNLMVSVKNEYSEQGELLYATPPNAAAYSCPMTLYMENPENRHPARFENSGEALSAISNAVSVVEGDVTLSLYTNCTPRSVKRDFKKYSEEFSSDISADFDGENCGWRLKMRDFPYGGAAALSREGKTMSVLAYDDEENEIVDLRAFVIDGELKWDAPHSNFRIYQFYCERSTDVYVNLLSYAESRAFLEENYGRHIDAISGHTSLDRSVFYFSNLQFNGLNRNIWSPSFNEAFKAEFGYDPAPHYLSLFMNSSESSASVRADFVKMRSKLLENGFISAAVDFCSENGITPSISQCEARMAESLWISGDPILSRRRVMPTAQMNWAYLYGVNSIKTAAAASLFSESGYRVGCEMFSCCESVTRESIYRDTAIAFARGADRLFINYDVLHDKMVFEEGTQPFDMNKYIEFVTRLQILFSQGCDVSDIALMYPVDSLACQTYSYYKDDEYGFEYPATIQNADWPDLVNSLTCCCGRDVTLLHPELIKSKCTVASGKIKLHGGTGREFSILILPSSMMTSLESIRFAKEFFESGGKIIATGMLPSGASEQKNSDDSSNELRLMLSELFGKDAFDPMIIKERYEKKNELGGHAVYLPSNYKSIDGTYMVSGSLLSQIISDFSIQSDVIIEDMPRVEVSGLFDLSLEEYLKAEYSPKIGIGGVFNYRHVKNKDTDVYFFANATNNDYNGKVLLSSFGKFEEWNPYTGKTRNIGCVEVEHDGHCYSQIELDLSAGNCTVIISR